MAEERAWVQKSYEMAAEYLLKNGLQALYGLLILFIGIKIGGMLEKWLANVCKKRHMDITISNFLGMILKIVVIAFASLIALEKFGITISPIIAAVSAAIFGASFAMQAPLSNYAAGLTIIFSRPFAVGNIVTIKGYSGVVEEIKIPFTLLKTATGEKVTIPNKHIVGEIVTNSLGSKFAEIHVGISYSDDLARAIHIIKNVLKEFPQVAQTPEPKVGIFEFGDSSVNISVRYWAPINTYLDTTFAVNLSIFENLKKAGITIPFPQRDVHLISAGNGAKESAISR